MHNIYINSILYTLSTLTCFNASVSSSGNLKQNFYYYSSVILAVVKLLIFFGCNFKNCVTLAKHRFKTP